MNRVLNSSKYLKDIVQEGKIFYIGFGIKNLTELGKGHPGLLELISGTQSTIIVTGRKGPLKDNTHGKLVRKQPEQKESVWKHIHYYSKRFGQNIDYDREFHVWEKTILYKYNLALEVAKTPQDEKVLHFPAFKMENSEDCYLKAGAAMNMSIALGSYFMIYDNKFEPIVPVTKVEHRKILESGNLSVSEKLEIIKEELKTQGTTETSEGNSYRFALLKEKKPTDVTIGLGGFNEYLMFEYLEDDLIILENLKTGNATYVFTLSKFNKDKALNKQSAFKDPSFLKRIIHNNLEDWQRQFKSFFK